MHLAFLSVADVRAIIVRKLGLPIGTFSLMSLEGREMHDIHPITDYDIEMGRFTVKNENMRKTLCDIV